MSEFILERRQTTPSGFFDELSPFLLKIFVEVLVYLKTKPTIVANIQYITDPHEHVDNTVILYHAIFTCYQHSGYNNI